MKSQGSRLGSRYQDPDAKTSMHIFKAFEDTISDKSDLHSSTLFSKGGFQYILDLTDAHVIVSGNICFSAMLHSECQIPKTGASCASGMPC